MCSFIMGNLMQDGFACFKDHTVSARYIVIETMLWYKAHLFWKAYNILLMFRCECPESIVKCHILGFLEDEIPDR